MLLYLICGIICGFLYFKTNEWQTIVRLGFRSEAPAFFLKYSSLYHYICYVLFLIMFGSVVFQFKGLLLWFGIVGILFEFFLLVISGRKKAFREYRKILTNLLKQSKTDSEKQNIIKQLEKSDSELLDQSRKVSQ